MPFRTRCKAISVSKASFSCSGTKACTLNRLTLDRENCLCEVHSAIRNASVCANFSRPLTNDCLVISDNIGEPWSLCHRDEPRLFTMCILRNMCLYKYLSDNYVSAWLLFVVLISTHIGLYLDMPISISGGFAYRCTQPIVTIIITSEGIHL